MIGKAKLALVISDLDAGGAQRVLTLLAKAWADQGRAVTVITLAGTEADAFALDDKVARMALDLRGVSGSAAAAVLANLTRIRRLRQAIRASGADTVIGFVGATNILTVLACLGLGLRVIVSERNDPARQSLGRVWDWLRRRLYRWADLVSANSQGALATLSRWVPAAKLAYVPNPLDLPREIVAQPSDHPVLLSVGRLSHQKGYDRLLEAFAGSQARQNGWQLRILGEGPLDAALRAQTKELGLEQQVDWRGRVEDPFPHYAGASAFVLASRHEGTPNVLLEAMACGLPALVTEDCGGALDLIEPERSGLVASGNPRDLGAAIDRLCLDPALRARLGDAAKTRVAGHRLEAVLPLWDALVDGAPASAASPLARPVKA